MKSTLWNGIWFSPDDSTGGGKSSDDDGDGDGKGKKPDPGSSEDEALEWESWHKALPKEAQELISDRESGLKTALGTERDARKDAEKDLRAVAKKLEEGSDAQKEVLRLADEVADGTKKSDFYEDAHKAGVSNLKLAYHIADTDELFDKRGNVDFDKLKKDFPELFGKKAPPPDATGGDGTGSEVGGRKKDMNTAIRAAAGRG